MNPIFDFEETDDKLWEKAIAESIEYEKKIKEEFNIALEYYKKNISFSFDSLYDDNILYEEDWDCWHCKHVGYCRVEPFESFAYKNSYQLVKEDSEKYNLNMIFSKQSEMDNGYHELIWQTCGYMGDDYSGYLLFPMKDGKYWIVSYSC